MIEENPAADPKSMGWGALCPPGRPRRILVVDDDAALRRLNSRVLTNAGYQVITGKATSGYIHDLIMDDARWTIRQLVVKTGHRFSGEELLISTPDVKRVSHEESTVFVEPVNASSTDAVMPLAPV